MKIRWDYWNEHGVVREREWEGQINREPGLPQTIKCYGLSVNKRLLKFWQDVNLRKTSQRSRGILWRLESTENCFGLGSAPAAAEGTHDASSDPIVGWEGLISSQFSTPSTLSAFWVCACSVSARRRRRPWASDLYALPSGFRHRRFLHLIPPFPTPTVPLTVPSGPAHKWELLREKMGGIEGMRIKNSLLTWYIDFY